MQEPNPNPSPRPSKDSTSNAKTSRAEETSLKTALKVLTEFSAGDNDTGRGGREDKKRVDESGDRVMSEGPALKKRKSNEEKENPSENRICPKCKKEFPTWETTIGHMQEHPSCTSIGSSSALVNLYQFDLNKVDDDVQPMEIEGTSNVALESAEEKVHERKDLGFDLNELPPKEEDDVM